jgi:hypothetical protein
MLLHGQMRRMWASFVTKNLDSQCRDCHEEVTPVGQEVWSGIEHEHLYTYSISLVSVYHAF